MRLMISERRVVTKEYAARYRRASRKEKGRMLQEFVESTGYHRVYAAWLLRKHGARVGVGPGVAVEGAVGVRMERRGRREYGPEVAEVVKAVWEVMDYMCGKRLAAVLGEVAGRLVEMGELEVEPEVLEQVRRVSAATIDRMLAGERVASPDLAGIFAGRVRRVFLGFSGPSRRVFGLFWADSDQGSSER